MLWVSGLASVFSKFCKRSLPGFSHWSRSKLSLISFIVLAVWLLCKCGQHYKTRCISCKWKKMEMHWEKAPLMKQTWKLQKSKIVFFFEALFHKALVWREVEVFLHSIILQVVFGIHEMHFLLASNGACLPFRHNTSNSLKDSKNLFNDYTSSFSWH